MGVTILERLFRWVDKDDPQSGRKFSPRRVGRLLIAIFAAHCFVAVPVAVIKLMVPDPNAPLTAKEQAEETMREAKAAYQRGEGEFGEAARRLMEAE